MNPKYPESVKLNQDEKLKILIEKTLKQESMDDWCSLVERLAEELEIDHLECAAALACLNQKNHQLQKKQKTRHSVSAITKQGSDVKMIRYRLEIGRKHHVSVEEIKNILVNETGVEMKQIGFIDLHAFHTVIDLPDGMPTDIFYHMKSVIINNKPLSIKRLEKDKKSDKKSAQGRRRRKRFYRQNSKEKLRP